MRKALLGIKMNRNTFSFHFIHLAQSLLMTICFILTSRDSCTFYCPVVKKGKAFPTFTAQSNPVHKEYRSAIALVFWVAPWLPVIKY